MIPLVDLKAQQASLREQMLAAVARVLDSGQYALGAEVAAFEQEFADWSGTRFGIGVNSGTSALHLALLAAGVGPGDEVITVPFTFVATVAAIWYTGARPVLVDVEPQTYTIDTGRIAAAVTPRTKAIIPVHLYGQTADMDPILEIARDAGAAVIEDASQAHGAEYKGRRAGSIGDLGCFSFYPTKTLGACGEGGLVLTADEALARRCRALRDWGQEQKHQYSYRGFNYRMSSMQAAILRVKLPLLDSWVALRRRYAALYDRLLDNSPVARPTVLPDSRHAYHIYAVLSDRRNELAAGLLERSIQTAVHYPEPVHRLSAWSGLGYSAGEFPVSERLACEVLSLPMYPELSDEAVRQVASSIREVTALWK